MFAAEANLPATEYKRLGEFSEGLASATTMDGEEVVIDKTGAVVFSLSKMNLIPSWGLSGLFNEGLMEVESADGTLRGYVNREGELVIPPKFSVAWYNSSFRGGYAVVQIPSPSPETRGKWGCIRRDGSFAIPPEYDRLDVYSGDGRAFGYKEGAGWLLLDLTGKTVGEKIFERRGHFSEGLAPAYFDGRWGYIDREGEWKIPPRFNRAYDFNEGYAGVLLDGHGGFIDREGNMVFDRLQWIYWGLRFREGTAFIVETSEDAAGGKSLKWGYLFKDGRKIPAIYDQMNDQANDFYDGRAFVAVGGRVGIIDENGSWVVAPGEGDFERTYRSRDGTIAAVKGGKYGVLDRDGGWAVQPEYDFIGGFSEGCAAARKDGKWGYIDKRGEWLF
jgi:hypothetical protein